MTLTPTDTLQHFTSERFYEVLSQGKVKITALHSGVLPENAEVVYFDNGMEKRHPLTMIEHEQGAHRFEATLELETRYAYFQYYFRMHSGSETRDIHKEEPYIGFTGHIHDVPAWAKDAVWYQIFPERFRNGDPSSDPTLDDIREGHIGGWKIKDWGSDWYSQDEWEKKNFSTVFESIYRRRYGGDLQGILDKLDYLQDLGITAIYLNPIFRAPSLHKYDAMCYHHVDETLGPDPKGDRELLAAADEAEDPSTWVWTSADRLFLHLVQEVHRRGMRIILDGVFNHSSRYCFAFQDILKYQQDSRFTDWYDITAWDRCYPDGFDYLGWYGFKYLPQFKRDENNVNEGYKRYIFDVTRRWLSPNGKVEDGIDGWRLDVAFCLPHGFWKEWRRHVKSINPDAYLAAEIVGIQPEFLRGDEFDGSMNYPFAFAVINFFANKKDKTTATKFDAELQKIRDAYPDEILYVVQNLMDSHDSSRLRTLIVNPDMRYGNWDDHHGRSKLETNPAYRIDRGNEEHKAIHKLIAAFQMTYPGAPMIYYGDEVGMCGANDPDCRKPMVWDDIEYEDEKIHPIPGKSKPPEKNVQDKNLLEYYKKLIRIRNQHPALRRGTYRTVIIDDAKDIFGFEREYENERILVIFNNSDKEQQVSLMEIKGTAYSDLLNPGAVFSVENNSLHIHIKPRRVMILLQGEG